MRDTRTIRHGDTFVLGVEVGRDGRAQFSLAPRGMGGRRRARRFSADMAGWQTAWREFATEEPMHAQAYADTTRPRRAATRPAAAPAVPLLTLPSFPGREVVEVLGHVMAHPVMSRDFLSDAGSDLASTFGGRLEGMETAISLAAEEARRQLHEQAARVGADAVIGLAVSVESVSAKAQAVLMSGTAVRTRPLTSGDPSPA